MEISEEDEDEEEEEEEEQTPAKKRTKAAGKAGGGGGAQATKGRQRGRAEKGDAKPAKRRRSAGMGGGCELSPEMRAFLGVPRMPRPQVGGVFMRPLPGPLSNVAHAVLLQGPAVGW